MARSTFRQKSMYIVLPLAQQSWGDIDFEENRVHVQRDIDYVGSTAQDGALKTAAAERFVPIPEELQPLLKKNRSFAPEYLFHPYSPVYMTCIDEAKADLQANARPELVSMPDGIEKYDTIILAYPNYWGTIPMAVATFLEAFDFSGKTILPLCTNEGSGMGSSESAIKKYAKGAAVRKGLSITGSQASNSRKAVEQWLKSNGMM